MADVAATLREPRSCAIAGNLLAASY